MAWEMKEGINIRELVVAIDINLLHGLGDPGVIHTVLILV